MVRDIILVLESTSTNKELKLVISEEEFKGFIIALEGRSPNGLFYLTDTAGDTFYFPLDRVVTFGVSRLRERKRGE